MFLGGPRLNTVFRSRKRALWFAAAVLATAYCSVPGRDEGAGDSRVVTAKHDDAPAAKWWAKDAAPRHP